MLNISVLQNFPVLCEIRFYWAVSCRLQLIFCEMPGCLGADPVSAEPQMHWATRVVSQGESPRFHRPARAMAAQVWHFTMGRGKIWGPKHGKKGVIQRNDTVKHDHRFCITIVVLYHYHARNIVLPKIIFVGFGCFWCLQYHGTIFGGIWEEFQRQLVANWFYWCVDRYLAIPIVDCNDPFSIADFFPINQWILDTAYV